MKKKIPQKQVLSAIKSFNEEVSIYKILFQDRTTALLRYVVEKAFVDRAEKINFRLPSVLLVRGEGKALISKAFSNSMCNKFEHIQGKHLSTGGSAGSIFENVNSETVYFISSADKLTAYSISYFHQFLNQGFIKFRNPITRKPETVSSENKLFIFSVNDPKGLCSDLKRSIEYHCYLTDYNIGQMEIIVEQRLKWCGIDYANEVPAIIVRNGQGSMSKCIRLLSVCYLIMRGDGRRNMTVKDVEIGIALNKEQEGVGALPVEDGIPF